jgi:fibronectin-binding autotransporter adhesin
MRMPFWKNSQPKLRLGTCLCLIMGLVPSAHAATITWRNTGTTFSTGTNWVGLSAPANDLNTDIGAFTNATVTANPQLTANRQINGLIFNAGTGAWTFTGQNTDRLELGGSGIVNNSSSTQTFTGADLNIRLGANATFTGDNGALAFNASLGGFELQNFNLTLGGASLSNSIAESITGTGGIRKTGTGVWTLSGANSYSGTTVIGTANGANAGTIRLGANNVLPGTAVTVFGGTLDVNTRTDTIGALNLGGGASGSTAQVLIDNAGVLTLGGNITYDAANNPNGATISGVGTGSLALGGATRTFTVGNSTAATNDLTISAIITGANNIIKDGAGQLALSGSNTYTGTTTINAGTVSLQNNAGLGATNGGTTVASGAALELQGGLTVTGEALGLSGTGVGNNGALRNVSGTNTWTGVTTLNAATEIQSDAGRLNLSGNVTAANQNLTVDGAADTAISGVVGLGSGTVTKNGSGNLFLSESNTYTGATAVNAGVLNIQNNNALGATNSGTTVASGAVLELQGGITVTNEALTVSGTGIGNNGALRNISGTNTWGGAVTLATNTEFQTDAGRLVVSGAITSTNQGLTIDGAGNTTLSGPISLVAGPITKAGAGTLTISGSNSSSGLLSVTGGKLEVGAGNNLGTGAISLDGGTLRSTNSFAITPSTRTMNIGTNGGTVETVAGTTLTYEGIMLGTGKLTKTGTGTFQTGQLANYNVAAAIGGVANAGLGIASFYNFDQLIVGTTNTTVLATNSFGPTNSMNITFTGDTGVRTGNSAGFWAAPFLSGGNGEGFGTNGTQQTNGVDSTPYLATGATTNDTITFVFNKPVEYLGVLWGSVDAGVNNTMTFRDATNGTIFTITGQEVLNSPDGNQGTNGTVYANINSDRPIYSVVATSPQRAFEFDNIATANQVLRTGPVDILEGNFQIINAGFFNGIGTNDAVFIQTNATFSFAGNTNLRQQTIGNLSGGGTVINQGATNVDFRVNASSNSTFSGTMTDTTNRSLNFTKLGAGTLTLSGNNTYDGTTRVSAGTLVLANTNGQSLAGTTNITVDAGATLELGADNQINNSANLILNGGTFRVGNATNGYSDTLGTLTVNSNSIIDLGSFTGAHTLTFANSSAITWATNATLTITNWQGTPWTSGTAGDILFGVGGLTSQQLSQVRWGSQGGAPGAGLIGSNGELVPIPEPKVWIALALVTCLIAGREIKTRLRKSGDKTGTGKDIDARNVPV